MLNQSIHAYILFSGSFFPMRRGDQNQTSLGVLCDRAWGRLMPASKYIVVFDAYFHMVFSGVQFSLHNDNFSYVGGTLNIQF